MNKSRDRYFNIRRASLVGAVINVLLGGLKISVGILGHSQALIVDGLHSLSDLFTDFMVIFAAKWGSQAPDLEHPYGHGRIETLGTIIVAFMIILVGLGFGYDAAYDIVLQRDLKVPTISVVVVAILSIVTKEWLYHYTLNVTQSVSFDLAYSNAWHHRSDALTSVVVLVGVVVAMLGVRYADHLAAILVSFVLVKIGVQMIWNNLKELIDTGVDATLLTQIQQVIQKTPGVLSIHLLRTRSMGGHIFVDVHVMVTPTISVSEGHYIGDQVSLRLKAQFSNIVDVTVHIDPENDEQYMVSSQLPNRLVVEKDIQALAKNLKFLNSIQKVELHYLAGKVCIVLFIVLGDNQYQQLCKEVRVYQAALYRLPYVGEVNVYYI